MTRVETADRPVVIFDGVCNFCDSAVNFAIDRDPKGALAFAASQSDAGRALMGRFGVESSETIYLVEGSRISDRSTAALRIARLLKFPWNLAAVFLVVPRPVRDAVYGLVARNRYRWFGRRDSCRMPTDRDRGRFL